MDGTDFLPNDLAECQRLLLAAFKQATQLERRVAESEQQAAELNRVLERNGRFVSRAATRARRHARRTGMVQALGLWPAARAFP